jgi:hypothetical protein
MKKLSKKAKRRARQQAQKLHDVALMVDMFCACIETRTLPAIGSPCHRKARQLVDSSGLNSDRVKTSLD